jgi:hypothetical protein
MFRWLRRSAFVAAVVIAVAGMLIADLTLQPALAHGGAIRIGPYAIISCSSGSACQVYNNMSSGPAFEGETGHGTGLYGTASKTGTGVNGVSSSGIGVNGLSTSSTGVYGTSSSSFGVFGLTGTGTGVQGQTSSTGGQSGVSGISIGTSGSAHGVYGRSSNGQGVFGMSSGDNGVEGHSTHSGSSGVAGIELGTSSGSGDGVYSESADTTNLYEALEAKADGSNTYIFEGFNASTNGLCTIDFNAALSCTGGAVVKNVRARHRNSDGQDVLTYASESTSATLEDFGTARMTGGVANVAIEAAFASTIDRSTPYYVFLTPLGDTRGLYVSAKTPAGFQVRETQGGRSTLSFDYRIVARPLDAEHDRLPLAPAMRRSR